MSEATEPVVNFHLSKYDLLGDRYYELIESLVTQNFDVLGGKGMKFNVHFQNGTFMSSKGLLNKEQIMDSLKKVKTICSK